MSTPTRLGPRAWALWGVLVLALLVCPALVAGPMIAYVLDPELLVLAVLFGTRSGRMELGVLWLRIRTGGQRLRPGAARPSRRASQRPTCRPPHPRPDGRRRPSSGPGGASRPGRPTRGCVRPGRTAPSRYPARPR